MLQNLEDYICIQQLIQTYIERHLILSIENYIDMYNANILDTHLKRWEKLSKKSNKLSNIVIKNSNFNFKLFSLYLLILNCKLYSINLKKILLDYTISYDYKHLLDFSILNNKPNIMKKILSLWDCQEYITNKFSINYYKGTSASKIIKKIDKSSLNNINKSLLIYKST
jgi:hypothetical protein